MQRILLSLCTGTLLLFVQPKAQAQEQASPTFKRNLIGGGFSFSTSKSDATAPDGQKAKSTQFSPSVTYVHYIKERVGLGVQAAYLHSSRNYPFVNLPSSKSDVYWFSPFVRLDIPLWDSRFSIFNDLGLNGSYSKSRDQYPNNQVVSETWNIGASYSPGIMFRLKSNVSLQLSYGQLLSYNYSHEETGSSHSAGLRSGSTIGDLQFGINFLF